MGEKGHFVVFYNNLQKEPLSLGLEFLKN